MKNKSFYFFIQLLLVYLQGMNIPKERYEHNANLIKLFSNAKSFLLSFNNLNEEVNSVEKEGLLNNLSIYLVSRIDNTTTVNKEKISYDRYLKFLNKALIIPLNFKKQTDEENIDSRDNDRDIIKYVLKNTKEEKLINEGGKIIGALFTEYSNISNLQQFLIEKLLKEFQNKHASFKRRTPEEGLEIKKGEKKLNEILERIIINHTDFISEKLRILNIEVEVNILFRHENKAIYNEIFNKFEIESDLYDRFSETDLEEASSNSDINFSTKGCLGSIDSNEKHSRELEEELKPLSIYIPELTDFINLSDRTSEHLLLKTRETALRTPIIEDSDEEISSNKATASEGRNSDSQENDDEIGLSPLEFGSLSNKINKKFTTINSRILMKKFMAHFRRQSSCEDTSEENDESESRIDKNKEAENYDKHTNNNSETNRYTIYDFDSKRCELSESSGKLEEEVSDVENQYFDGELRRQSLKIKLLKFFILLISGIITSSIIIFSLI